MSEIDCTTLPEAFGNARVAALTLWIGQTKRESTDPSDISGSFECRWQNKAIDEKGFRHVGYFCSLASWACSVTDILLQTNYDCEPYDENSVLYRHYTRLLLVVSEILDDLVALATLANSVASVSPGKKKSGRAFLSRQAGLSVDDLMAFINNVCKHKSGKLHACNFDLPCAFEDDPLFVPDPIQVRAGHLEFASPKKIVMPKLTEIISVVLHAYQTLENLFSNDEPAFKRVCAEYDEPAVTV